MKLTSSKLLQGAIALAIFSIGACGYAQDFSKIAVVDYSGVLKEYYKAKKEQNDLEVVVAGFRKDQNEREAGFKSVVESINQLQKEIQDPAISDAKKKEKENQMKLKGEEAQVKQRELMAFGQTASKIIEDKKQTAMIKLSEEVNNALSQIAKNKYSMVFVKPQVPQPGALIFSEGLDDITSQVLVILNKDAPAGKKDDKKEEKK
jgi:Skp family chaperone for outer membrane proteins